MPSSNRAARSAGTFAVLTLAAAASVFAIGGACGGSRRGARPYASFASTAEAGVAFDRVREAWEGMGPLVEEAPGVPRVADRLDRDADAVRALRSPAEVRGRIEAFLSAYPDDGMVGMARALLVFLLLHDRDMGAAERELRALEAAPRVGTLGDLVAIGRARRDRLAGRPSMDELVPRNGKVVDPIARALFQEELALTAIAMRLEEHAVSYLDAWLRGTSEDDREAVKARVAEIVASLGRAVLEPELDKMRESATALAYTPEMQRILADRLAHLAVDTSDDALARRLLDTDAGAVQVEGDLGARLGELALVRTRLNVVDGRTIGLLLPIEATARRDQSADVLRGVMWALGLPRGVRTLGRPGGGGDRARADGRDAGAHPYGRDFGTADAGTPCAHPVTDAELPQLADIPRPEDQIRLVTRDDPGERSKTVRALDELRGQGAAVIVAGLDEASADVILPWAEKEHVPVLLLAPPLRTRPRAYAFVFGEDRGGVLAALASDVPELTASSLVPVIDRADLRLFSVPRVGRFTLASPVSCEVQSTRAGEPRFPIATWSRSGSRTFLVTGSNVCARDLVDELSSARAPAQGTVALTLEAATNLRSTRAVRVVTAAAGSVPLGRYVDPRDTELQAFAATFGGALTWWTAVARDAATLARLAVNALPTDSTGDLTEVQRRRDLVRDRVGSVVEARLWTSERHGLGGARVLGRTICTTEL